MQTMAVSGAVLKRLEESMGWNLTTAAKRYGISHSFLGRIHRGERQPSPAVAKRIADAHGLSLGDIITKVKK